MLSRIFVFADGRRKRASYITKTKSAQPSINPKVNYSISLSTTGICISYFKGISSQWQGSHAFILLEIVFLLNFLLMCSPSIISSFVLMCLDALISRTNLVFKFLTDSLFVITWCWLHVWIMHKLADFHFFFFIYSRD